MFNYFTCHCVRQKFKITKANGKTHHSYGNENSK